jgi:hypothetical protein
MGSSSSSVNDINWSMATQVDLNSSLHSSMPPNRSTSKLKRTQINVKQLNNEEHQPNGKAQLNVKKSNKDKPKTTKPKTQQNATKSKKL